MQKVKTRLEIAFGKKVKIVNEKTLRVHVSSLDAVSIYQLGLIQTDFGDELTDMEIKRSGTGLTILVKVK